MWTLSDIKIELDRAEVCRYLGYPRGEIPAASRSSVINGQIAEAYSLVRPSCSYTIKRIEGIKGSKVFIEDSLAFASNIISRALSHCNQVAIYLATIGSDLEEKVSELMRKGQTLKGAILDAAGSEAVEKAALYFEERMKMMASIGGAEISLRYSPGYCDWDISQQEVLFKVMNPSQLEVKLAEDYWMVPRKSTSGIIGIGRSGGKISSFNPCLSCNKKNCLNRRVR